MIHRGSTALLFILLVVEDEATALANKKHQRRKRRSTHLRDSSGGLPRHGLRLPEQHARAHGNVLGIRAAVRQAKNLIADLESVAGGGLGTLVGPLAARSEGVDDAAKLDAEGCRGLGREGIPTEALDDVHAVDAKGPDADEGLTGRRLRGGHVGVDEEGVQRAGAAFDI